LNTGPGAAVIDITAHRNRTTGKGWRAMTEPTLPVEETETVRQAYAGEVEAAFNAAGYTLTDETTAGVYLRTLDVVVHALNGAAAQELVTAEQRDDLAELIEDMRSVPRLV
jgi:hypothetical protein